MPELLSLDHQDWTLSVWSKDIFAPRNVMENTLQARNKSLPKTRLRFQPEVNLSVTNVDEPNPYVLISDALSQPLLPLFFENRLYEFEIQFTNKELLEGEPIVVHSLRSIEDAFHYRRGSLRGVINFGNHIGWFRLNFKYRVKGKEKSQSISFEVFPTKMDVENDLAHIQQMVDHQYPLWRFSLAQKTEQALSETKKAHENFSLLWLAHFTRLREELVAGIKLVLNSPHARLQGTHRKKRADKIRGKISGKFEHRLSESLKGKQYDKRFSKASKVLSVNTPENRFIKMVLSETVNQLNRIITFARKSNASPDHERLSTTFFSTLDEWKTPLETALRQPFFREVGNYQGLSRESLVLHQKVGYSNVYKVWQELKKYLDVLGQQSSISLKSVAELYEVWCVLEIRRLLLDSGFTEIDSRKAQIKQRGLEKQLKEGIGAAFRFERGDGVTVRLAHEPVFSKPRTYREGKTYTWTTVQKPDILLEATFPQGQTFQWIFDAKYRIANRNDIDLAPDDAINQMHRYRDALIQLQEFGHNWQEKRRPIVGSYVLYPGNFNEGVDQNPYSESINEVGIGAFPLLPGRENNWLKVFLSERLGAAEKAVRGDYNYLREAIRIAPSGLQLSRYSDLTLLATLGPKRDKEYIERFRDGTAGWYHVPLSTTNRFSVSRAAMKELRFFGVAVRSTKSSKSYVEFVYRVDSVKLKQRSELTREQSGAKPRDGNNTQYWVLQLSRSYRLAQPIELNKPRGFSFQLTEEKALLSAKHWDDLPKHYEFLS